MFRTPHAFDFKGSLHLADLRLVLQVRRLFLFSVDTIWVNQEEDHMPRKTPRLVWFLAALLVLLPASLPAQSFKGSISGTATDPTGAVIPNAQMTLTLIATGFTAKSTTGDSGLYSFPNLEPGLYELKASAPGFRDFVQRGIEVAIGQSARLDVRLELGTAVQTVEVTALASPMNFETAEVTGGISPNTLQELPLLVSGTVRSAASFAILMPGVTTGGGGNPFDARINGGLQTGDEAVMDGASLQQGMMNQTGMISIYSDFPMTPDMVSELKVLTSSYAPEYGSSLSGQIVVESKSGSNEYHAGAYEYLRNTVLNARPYGQDNRPTDLEHDFGFYTGGPFRIGSKGIPLFWSGRKKTFFYLNIEMFRRTGGTVSPILSVPTAKMKNGDFSEWPYPVYDPRTTRVNPSFQPDEALTNFDPRPYLRDQFMGCDGNSPNAICMSGPNRFVDPATGFDVANSIAPQWLQYSPDPNIPGKVTANYIVPNPVQTVTVTNANYLMFRGDQYIGDRDHVSVTVWYQGAPPDYHCTLPDPLCSGTFSAPQFSFVDRARWDHTFSPTVLNHFGFGYLDRNEGYGAINWAKAPDATPRIAGASTDQPPVITLGDFGQYGEGHGDNAPNRTTRQTYVFLDTLTWVKGRHTFKFGVEYRNLGQNIRNRIDTGGVFDFGSGYTGLIGETSGNPIASFLLEGVENGRVHYQAIDARYPRSKYYIAHIGDTWKISPKVSINYGVRWDTMTPAEELYNHHSFLDPLGANPGAGGRPGRLAFAGSHDLATGDSWGAAGFSRAHPEETWWKGFAPRLGIAYSMTPKTVIRTGYGVFYTQAFYPGWEGSIATDGFSVDLSQGSSLGGLTPAFVLSQGFPVNPALLPPLIDSSLLNGLGGPQYKPFDANRRAYAQQWNLSIEHQFGNNFTMTGAYVANKGTRLPTRQLPLNALNPSLLSQYGTQLYDEFGPTDTSLHGVPVPYDGWQSQLSCSPSLAQALLPYPQYCGALQGINENAGNSTYHSFQFKAERRFSAGAFLLASYTLAKILGSADQTQTEALEWSGAYGQISPYERQRNKGLAIEDVPQTFSMSFVYELPFGRSKQFLNHGGVVDKVVGGWSMSNLFRASSGIPFYFRSGTCNVPGEFHAGCIPAILPGENPWAQGKGTFDPNKPLFRANAFEPISGFEAFGYYGQGPRVSNLRGFGFHNHNLGLIKNTKITERLNFQFRAEFFNIWNWHSFNCSNQCFGSLPFDIDISSPDFGKWNNSVSEPRNIQFGARLEF